MLCFGLKVTSQLTNSSHVTTNKNSFPGSSPTRFPEREVEPWEQGWRLVFILQTCPFLKWLSCAFLRKKVIASEFEVSLSQVAIKRKRAAMRSNRAWILVVSPNKKLTLGLQAVIRLKKTFFHVFLSQLKFVVSYWIRICRMPTLSASNIITLSDFSALLSMSRHNGIWILTFFREIFSSFNFTTCWIFCFLFWWPNNLAYCCPNLATYGREKSTTDDMKANDLILSHFRLRIVLLCS